jgi:phage tail-like protein
MTRPKKFPISQFNFLVTWDQMDGTMAEARFQEVSGLGMKIAMAEYRSGNAKTNEPIKVAGVQKTTHTTLRRGVICAQDLHEWLNLVRDGYQDQLKTVTITLLSESREEPIRWRLLAARPVKWTTPSLSGKDTDLVIEELVLSAERMELEAT